MLPLGREHRVVHMEKRRLGRLEHHSSVLIYGAAALASPTARDAALVR